VSRNRVLRREPSSVLLANLYLHPVDVAMAEGGLR